MNATGQRAIRQARVRSALFYWVVMPALTIAAGLLLDLPLPRWTPGGWAPVAGALLIVGGVALIWKATADLSRHGDGTPAPQAPASRLVTAGSYAWCRHPMFLGYDLAAWGVGLLLASPGMLLGTLPVMLVWQLRFLKREEALLARRFPDDWPAYRRRVPLLLPSPPVKREVP